MHNKINENMFYISYNHNFIRAKHLSKHLYIQLEVIKNFLITKQIFPEGVKPLLRMVLHPFIGHSWWAEVTTLGQSARQASAMLIYPAIIFKRKGLKIGKDFDLTKLSGNVRGMKGD